VVKVTGSVTSGVTSSALKEGLETVGGIWEIQSIRT
jgi:hypothetical protein